ncbi:Glycosyl transferase family 8 [Chlorella sorokiniana]|uniref:Glycosyl transferase family 8 n=1 Tax=Chlorella sorokiniana TaxID=3076 RepID=A0A2P6TLK0_CHLSO|nr:Glycosyl transferase family 8 [Chlorella sorokiniana]|eukprot:PRW45171.1 Glycosyl transferase family 8 [Chlorella sorokiniana]
MLILERRQQGRFAAYYNGGNIPLESALPLYRMPWVFTYNDWSAGSEYDYMVQAAVTSAVHLGRVLPYCLYSGSKLAPAYAWLRSRNVTIIEVVGTFQRIDIPVLPQLLQYEFVLFTDCDVYFRQRIKLVDWGTPLPLAVGMSGEGSDTFPFNAGVMLYNMPAMRHSYPVFLQWLLSQRNGHHYGAFGPLDQGAINKYYAQQLINRPVSQGPKPNHYVAWRQSGQCQFAHLCSQGFATGTCHYAVEYAMLVPDWQEATHLAQLCSATDG